MANSDKNIVIQPKTGTNDAPNITFTGADNAPVSLEVSDDGSLVVQSSAGQLFSISNSVTGTLFSVSDISGIPGIDYEDTGLVRLAPFNGKVVIGSSSEFTSATRTGADSSDALQIKGDSFCTGDSTVQGRITGTINVIGSHQVAKVSTINSGTAIQSSETLITDEPHGFITGDKLQVNFSGSFASASNGTYYARVTTYQNPSIGNADDYTGVTLFTARNDAINNSSSSRLSFNSTDVTNATGSITMTLDPVPPASDHTSGERGDIRMTDSHIYVRTSSEWKRVALTTF